MFISCYIIKLQNSKKPRSTFQGTFSLFNSLWAQCMRYTSQEYSKRLLDVHSGILGQVRRAHENCDLYIVWLRAPGVYSVYSGSLGQVRRDHESSAICISCDCVLLVMVLQSIGVSCNLIQLYIPYIQFPRNLKDKYCCNSLFVYICAHIRLSVCLAIHRWFIQERFLWLR
jgi:hypothetical protein